MPDLQKCRRVRHYIKRVTLRYFRDIWFPMVPYHNLPRLHKLIKHDLPGPNYGFIDGLREVFYALRRQLSDPEYRISKELPSTAKPYNHYSSDAV